MILIIDFGSQYSQLIARKIRKEKIYSQIHSPKIKIKEIKEISPKGIILSGSPEKITSNKFIKINSNLFNLEIPILGICYGMHYIVEILGGQIKSYKKREYGKTSVYLKSKSILFDNIRNKMEVWMSHGDSIQSVPTNFKIDGYTENNKIAAISNFTDKIYGLQFHPEVEHTKDGNKIIRNFLFKICNCKSNWKTDSFINNSIENIRNTVKNKKVILGLSGGIDSFLTALLLDKAIKDQLTCIFIDNGLLRKNEGQKLRKKISNSLNCKVIYLNEKKIFLKGLVGVIDPEKKRKIVGKIFVEIFNREALKIKNVEYLAQGTLYPDIIESMSSFGGPSSLIKTHHNVGGLPSEMKLKLIEPLKYLFKDEVRNIALEMGLDNTIVWRQPFPGPGLSIRIIGEVTQKKLEILKNADYIVQEEIKNNGFYKKLWQAFAILLPIRSVGVMGDKRTYDYIIAVRAVTSTDAMTADWARLPYEILSKISARITNEVKGVNRVVYDISSKPPSTIEFE